ncbi:MAG: hypothetical protein DRH26_15710 [Deltaproteobacteria bacterium]|nr:MAG: hypothetical protein DRH26_15710 [Deltaproteobacteria bacterium]
MGDCLFPDAPLYRWRTDSVYQSIYMESGFYVNNKMKAASGVFFVIEYLENDLDMLIKIKEAIKIAKESLKILALII